MKNKVSFLRFLVILLCFLTVLVGTVALCLIKGIFIDTIVFLGIIDCLFMLTLTLSITNKRLNGKIYEGSNYLNFLIVIFIGFIYIFLASFLPDFSFPFIIIPLTLITAFDSKSSICLSIYFCILFAITNNTIYNVFYCCILMCIIGVLIGDYLKENEFNTGGIFSLYTGFIAFLINIIFTYFSYKTLLYINLIKSGIIALVSIVFVLIVMRPMNKRFLNERTIAYETIIDENHPILLDIKRISIPEYSHAIRVANIAGDCADLIGADKFLCMAGGLYYNAYRISPGSDRELFFSDLNNRCFPPEVIKLISESTGKLTSKESAIVSMTDTLVTKFEALFKKADITQWNTTMVVYKTLNELSEKGTYDECGLSMNAFLNIRDFLAKQDYN